MSESEQGDLSPSRGAAEEASPRWSSTTQEQAVEWPVEGFVEREPFRPLAGRARAVYILVWVAIGCALLAGVAYANMSSVAGDAYNLSGLDPDRLANAEGFMGLAALLFGLVYLGGIIAFIVWFRAAYRNLRAMNQPQRFRQGWAVGSWFVPIFNLVRPKSMTNDIAAAAREKGSYRWLRKVRLNLWWGFAILQSFLATSPENSYQGAATIEEIKSAMTFGQIWVVITVVAGIFTIQVVRAVTESQSREPAAAAAADPWARQSDV